MPSSDAIPSRASRSLDLLARSEIRPRDRNAIHELIVIGIPGYGTTPVRRWNLACKMKHAASHIPSIAGLQVYGFDFGSALDRDLTWQTFLENGHELLSCLQGLSASIQGHDWQPILFVAHSLGGTILKEAICTAHRLPQQFDWILRGLCGIIFLSTPHAGNNDHATWDVHASILKSSASLNGRQRLTLSPTPDEVFRISNVAVQFERCGLGQPILSVYEMPRDRFFRSRAQRIVDKPLSETHARSEELLPVRAEHADLYDLELVDGKERCVTRFLRNALDRWLTEQGDGASSMALDYRKFTQSLVTDDSKSIINDLGISLTDGSESLDTRGGLEQIAQDAKRLLAKRKVQLPCFMILTKTRNSDFVNRASDLKRMDDVLLPRSSTECSGPCANGVVYHRPAHYAICGIPGLGKTDLALEFVYTRRQYFGAIFWVEAAGRQQLAASFSRIAVELGLETSRQFQDPVTSRELVKAWLYDSENLEHVSDPKTMRRTQWLLVFDEADNMNLLKDYWPREGKGSILVTSRDPLAKSGIGFLSSGVDLEPLSKEQGAEMIKRLAGCDESEEEMVASQDLANLFGGYPLALTQMAGIIRRRDISVKQFLDQYTGSSRYMELRNESNLANRVRYVHNLATAINIKDLSPTATTLLQILSLLNPDRIKEDLFVRRGLSARPRLETLADTERFERARTELICSSLVKRNRAKRELWIHSFVQLEVQVQTGYEKLHGVFEDAVVLLAQSWPFADLEKRAYTRGLWKASDELLRHLDTLYVHYREYSDKWGGFRTGTEFLNLLCQGGAYLHEKGLSQQGRPYLELALSICQTLDTDQPLQPLLSDIMYTLGAAANWTGDAKTCLQTNERLLNMRKAIALKTGKEDIRLGLAHNQLGVAHMMIGKLASATAHFCESIRIFRLQEPFDVDLLGFPCANLGLAYWLQGQLKGAEHVFAEAKKEREAKFGILDVISYKTGRIYHGLGNVMASKAIDLRAQRRPQEAAEAMEESWKLHSGALVQYESTLGAFHHRVADVCHDLGKHHIRREEHDEAQAKFNRALGIWGETPWYRAEVARTSFVKGQHLITRGGHHADIGHALVQKARDLRRSTRPQEEDREFVEADYDEAIIFWSR